MENNSGLTFDLDDMTIEDEKVIYLLNWLCDEFGTENVWYRISSSGDGLHVMIGELVISNITGIPELNPILLSTEEQMKYRTQVEFVVGGVCLFARGKSSSRRAFRAEFLISNIMYIISTRLLFFTIFSKPWRWRTRGSAGRARTPSRLARFEAWHPRRVVTAHPPRACD